MRRATPLFVLLLSIEACAFPGATATAPRAGTSASVSPSPTRWATPEPQETSEESTPQQRLATRLTSVNARFYDLYDEWMSETGGKPRGLRFRSLELLGLKKQKLMRRLVKKERLSNKTLPLLPSGLRLEAKRNIKAGRDLYQLTTPLKPPVKMKTSEAAPPKKLLRHYDEGEERFDVPWSILAAVNLIESKMGRLNGPSSSGALGPMQFMPATWDAYGHGSPFDPHNAIIAAARYLSANGAPGDMRNALWHYNHSDAYVNAVLSYHRQMAGKPVSYFSYYFWQVFVRTTKGDLQLTGPGAGG